MASVDTGQRMVSAERLIHAPAEAIFDVLTDPHRHPEIDGSDTVVRVVSSAARLGLGSTFSMRMRQGFPYTVKNRVLEYQENRLIAWAHFGGHRWRWELEPQSNGSAGDSAESPKGSTTLVRETFDYRKSRWPRALELIRAPQRGLKMIESTLELLARRVEHCETGQHVEHCETGQHVEHCETGQHVEHCETEQPAEQDEAGESTATEA